MPGIFFNDGNCGYKNQESLTIIGFSSFPKTAYLREDKSCFGKIGEFKMSMNIVGVPRTIVAFLFSAAIIPAAPLNRCIKNNFYKNFLTILRIFKKLYLNPGVGKIFGIF